MSDVGDCFVAMSPEGFWDGEKWVEDWREARQFAAPPDPYGECRALADELRARLGIPCNAAYVPRSEIRVAKVPGRRRNARRRILR